MSRMVRIVFLVAEVAHARFVTVNDDHAFVLLREFKDDVVAVCPAPEDAVFHRGCRLKRGGVRHVRRRCATPTYKGILGNPFAVFQNIYSALPATLLGYSGSVSLVRHSGGLLIRRSRVQIPSGPLFLSCSLVIHHSRIRCPVPFPLLRDFWEVSLCFLKNHRNQGSSFSKRKSQVF